MDSVNLQSSSTLGTGRAYTHQERLDKAEDKEVRKALDGRSGKRKRHNDQFVVEEPDTDDDEHALKTRLPAPEIIDLTDPVKPVSVPAAPSAPSVSVVGGALRNTAASVTSARTKPKGQQV
jgi:ATP-dependent RNA helicase DHX37/DHR1